VTDDRKACTEFGRHASRDLPGERALVLIGDILDPDCQRRIGRPFTGQRKMHENGADGDIDTLYTSRSTRQRVDELTGLAD